MSDFSNNISNNTGPGSSAEPSMEEILASIRRILKEDEAVPSAKVDIEDDVLVLDGSMLAKPVDFSSATEPPPEHHPAAVPEQAPLTSYPEDQHITAEPAFFTQDFTTEESGLNSISTDFIPIYHPEPEDHMPENVEPPHGLMSEEASSAAASSIGALVRSISTERSVAVSRGGVTIEDIVREEIRPVLKAWLDTHLPSLVERLVRAEIARVIDRSTE